MRLNATCGFCNIAPEIDHHNILHCEFAKQVWFSSPLVVEFLLISKFLIGMITALSMVTSLHSIKLHYHVEDLVCEELIVVLKKEVGPTWGGRGGA